MIDKILLLKEIIKTQKSLAYFNSKGCTYLHKSSMYEAFDKMLNTSAVDIVSYLFDHNRKLCIQHKIFQEYISIIESKLPYYFEKNKKRYKIDSLLNKDLNIFDGVSIFESTILNNKEIKNETKEFYIGNRGGFYAQPFYIGKILDILDLENNSSLFKNIRNYTFSKIIMSDEVASGLKVRVIHLRIPPHYQMGGMTYLNRIKKKISEEIYSIENAKK